MGEQIEPLPARNRKRFLDLSENVEEEGSSRRPNLFSEWQETLKSIGVPSKKGFLGNESQYNDMIDQGLAENFEDSLCGLGVDISTASYNMSEAKMALPNVSLFKQDCTPDASNKTSIASTTPPSYDENSQSNTTDRFFKLLGTDSYNDSLPTPSIHQLLQHHLAFSENLHNEENVDPATSEHLSEEDLPISEVTDPLSESSAGPQLIYENNKFQFILGAATSVAVKVTEESLTYLNQGQSYEVKIKKLGDITRYQGRMFHTKLRICFHERRLQYMEKEQIASWKNMRPGERIIEIDVPLSYGITDVVQDSKCLNCCEFDWEPCKEVGVYVKVNCISTEFTPKKHGGEKGVPFRLQVETYSSSESGYDRLHACACQIKVFKLKGADRKHKQDREKIIKKSHEINKYQRQCECTILQEIPLDNLPESNSEEEMSSSNSVRNYVHKPIKTSPSQEKLCSPTSSSRCLKLENIESHCEESFPEFCGKLLDSSSSVEETHKWLSANRFSHLTSTFDNFGGTDILRLSRSELIDICGLVDGIRLYNGLHFRNINPHLTLYICMEKDPGPIYNAVYLEKMTLEELINKVSQLMSVCSDQIHDLYLQGPSNINILITDEVIRNMRDETIFVVDVLQDIMAERFRIVLRTRYLPKSPS